MKEEILAVITARGGSKRIPKKNIKIFLGEPIIKYSIDAALKSNIFSEIIVSTDDKKIVEIAKTYGAKVPFMRSKINSGDNADISDVLLEVIDKYRERGKIINYLCCIFPTAPLIRKENLIKGYQLMLENKFDSVFPVVKYNYPVQRSLKIKDDRVVMNWPENYKKRTQDLEIFYHDSGQFYWIKVDSFLKEKKIFMNNSGAIILSDNEVQDIDTEEDWKIAEIKYKILNKSYE